MARSVRVSLGFTQNLGNYESLRTGLEFEDDVEAKPEVSEEATVGPGETHEDVADRLFAAIEQKLIQLANENFDSMSKDARRDTKIRPKG